jgi:cellulose synthase/poly-beta-1,6-N-acetylglucosamine synthase-like glycosyltransferase
MVDSIVFSCVSLAAGAYCLRTALFIVGAALARAKSRRRVGKATSETATVPFISVVVPARNEESNIEPCLRSLLASDYPAGRFEVVAVNDRSTDGTGAILENYARQYPQLVIHNTREDNANPNLQGKPRAVHQGIMKSRGEIILMTDADCVVPPKWIAAIVERFADAKVGLVASYTLPQGARFFDDFQRLEWFVNNVMASAGVGFGQPLGCFGNNLSVRRDVYECLGGYPQIRFSVTEDLALLQAVIAAGWETRYVCDKNATITTLPCPDIRSFIKQHHRWVNGGKALGWRGAGFVLSSALLWVGILVSLASGSFIVLAALLCVRVVADIVLVIPAAKELSMTRELWKIPLAEPFFLWVELMTPFLGLKSTVEWKGQTLRNQTPTKRG